MRALEELLYETAVHALETQERQVAELRARTGSLLAAAALSASFLGLKAVERAGFSIPVLLSIAALAWIFGLCMYVLAPVRMGFALDVPELYRELRPEIDDERRIHLYLAYRLDLLWAENEPLVERLQARFRDATVVLVADFALWIVALTVA